MELTYVSWRGLSTGLLWLVSMLACIAATQDDDSARGPTATKLRNFYDYKVKTIDGLEMELDEYRGQVLLVVNLASQCGFTDGHYKSLARLHSGLVSTGRFNVLGFPCNQFGMQEPDDEPVIAKFVRETYDVKFPMFNKINVIEPHAHPIYKYLAAITGKLPNWNFWKYLIDHKGDVVGAWGPWTAVEEITPIIRTKVNDAVKAHPGPNQVASGPPQRGHDDYGDGASRDTEPWSESWSHQEKSEFDADPDKTTTGERAGSNPNSSPSEGTNQTPAKHTGGKILEEQTASIPLKPQAKHEDL